MVSAVAHAFARALGLCISSIWFGGALGISWAKLFRKFVALRCEEGVDREFLLVTADLEDVHAVLFSRVLALRTSIPYYFEFSFHSVNIAEISVYPPQQDRNLMEVHLACMLDHRHDVLVPKSTNFYAHKCHISAADLRMFSESLDGYLLLSVFFCVDWIYSGVQIKILRLMCLILSLFLSLLSIFLLLNGQLRNMSHLIQINVGVFAPIGSDLSSVISAQGRVLHDMDHQNSQTVAFERPHDR